MQTEICEGIEKIFKHQYKGSVISSPAEALAVEMGIMGEIRKRNFENK